MERPTAARPLRDAPLPALLSRAKLGEVSAREELAARGEALPPVASSRLDVVLALQPVLSDQFVTGVEIDGDLTARIVFEHAVLTLNADGSIDLRERAS